MIIAEIGSVHDGSFGNAKKLIEVAKNCGADFVKFRTLQNLKRQKHSILHILKMKEDRIF